MTMAKTSIVPMGDRLTQPKILDELRKIISYDAAIIDRMINNYNDSDGELLDPRLISLQKTIIETAKILKELDPVIKSKTLEMENEAAMAIEIHKKLIKDGKRVIQLEDLEDSPVSK